MILKCGIFTVIKVRYYAVTTISPFLFSVGIIAATVIIFHGNSVGLQSPPILVDTTCYAKDEGLKLLKET